MNSLRKKTDHELIQDFQGGDLYALETLILRHKEKNVHFHSFPG